MDPVDSQKTRLTINVTIEESLRIKLIELGISPSRVAKRALEHAVAKVERGRRSRERKAGLDAVQKLDPRIRSKDLMSSSTRIRKLRRMASAYEQSIGV